MTTKTLRHILRIIFWVILAVVYMGAPTEMKILYGIIIFVAVVCTFIDFLQDLRRRD